MATTPPLSTLPPPPTAGRTAPFARFEWIIAWRYLRAKRAEGGVSVMTWISLIGVTLAVFALVATLALRAGFRAEFVETIVGANAHVTVTNMPFVDEFGRIVRTIANEEELAAAIRDVPGVTDVAPLVRGQVLASFQGYDTFGDVLGIAPEHLAARDLAAAPGWAPGDLGRLPEGVAIGWGVAARLGIGVGDRISLVHRNGARTPAGTSPRLGVYEVVHVFSSGVDLIDRTRIYMPLAEAQRFFNRDGVADEIEVTVAEPDAVAALAPAIIAAAGAGTIVRTWQDDASGSNRALDMQDNFIFILLSMLVLIATLNIVSGLVMLVKNKGRDIGILRTMGLTEGSVLRVFFIVGASIGTIGTLCGVLLGVVFSLNIRHVYALVDRVSGNGVERLEAQGFFFPDALLQAGDMAATVGLSLALSWIVTIFPARRAARMSPVEALRYE